MEQYRIYSEIINVIKNDANYSTEMLLYFRFITFKARSIVNYQLTTSSSEIIYRRQNYSMEFVIEE